MKKWLKRLGLIFSIPLLLVLCAGLWLGFKFLTYSQTDDETHLAAKHEYLKEIAASAKAAPQADRPNIIFILYDDLGYGDFGATGSKAILTPNIDLLANQGVQLANFYSPAPVCTPSRAGFLTGRYAPRAGLPDVVFPTGDKMALGTIISGKNHRLPAEEITIADMLKAAGYRTKMIGKWHTGDRSPSLPNDFGFDQYFGTRYSNDMTPLAIYRNNDIAIKAPVDQTQINKLYTNEALQFIAKQQPGAAPFFLYFAHNFPHIPLHVSSDRLGKSSAGLYGDVVESLDWGVGELVKDLNAKGLMENTIIIISSDNGPWFQGSAGPSRGRKGDTFEGGMHVPFIIHWPKALQGGRTIDGMSIGIDLLPTLADWLKIPLPTDRIIDGKSIRNMLEAGGATPHDYLYYFASDQLMAIRDSRYKYMDKRSIVYAPAPGILGFGMAQKPWLFDMQNDRDESYDISANAPEKTKAYAKALKAKQTEMKNNLRGWVQ